MDPQNSYQQAMIQALMGQQQGMPQAMMGQNPTTGYGQSFITGNPTTQQPMGGADPLTLQQPYQQYTGQMMNPGQNQGGY